MKKEQKSELINRLLKQNTKIFQDLESRYGRLSFRDHLIVGSTIELVKYELMMKLKDTPVVMALKNSIIENENLSSQEQQELCAWIECAMDFGENLDEVSEQIEKAKGIIREYVRIQNACFDNADDDYMAKRDLLAKAEQFLNSEVEKCDYFVENAIVK